MTSKKIISLNLSLLATVFKAELTTIDSYVPVFLDIRVFIMIYTANSRSRSTVQSNIRLPTIPPGPDRT